MNSVPRGLVPVYRSGRSLVMRIPCWAHGPFASEDYVDLVLEHERKAVVFLPAGGAGLLKLMRRRGEPNSAYVMVGRLLRTLGVGWWARGTRYFRAELCEFLGKQALRVFFGEVVRSDGLPAEEVEEAR